MGQTGVMSGAIEQRSLLQELLLRVAALEENVVFLELWCEEQQDALDVTGPPAWPSENEAPVPRFSAVDVRDDVSAGREKVVELHEYSPRPGVEPPV